jgi:hypothetical protein
MQASLTTTTAIPSPDGLVPSIAGTVVLVALADVLILSTSPGIGWFLFVVAAAMVIGGMALWRSDPRACLVSIALGVVAALPLIEAPSLAGVAVVLAALAAAALLATGMLPAAIEAIPGVMARFAALAPFRLASDVMAGLLTKRVESSFGRRVIGQLMGWIVPLVFLAIFAGLFLAANPVIDLVASQLDFGTLTLPSPIRILFWILVAAAMWALLRPRLLPPLMMVTGAPAIGANESRLFGEAAIFRSLVVFNAIFAVQTLLDLTYLWGGAALPEGMTYADYAHRGAVPLIVTALLAAGFVLAAMRQNGPGMKSAAIRGLVYVWIAQNILLCVSSILRLDLYVKAYSLTELRVAAGIWMGLVAVGLLLILLRIALRKANGWLVATNLMSLTMTLYACAWIDVSAVIARFNIEHSREIYGSSVNLDLGYLRQLGPTVIPALDAYIAEGSAPGMAYVVRARLLQDLEAETAGDWRGWTWRTERLQSYLDSANRTDDNGEPLSP